MTHETLRRGELLAFSLLVGGAVMVVEVAAPRLVAPHLGTTAPTWIVTIGTFLLGIAIGNAIGGRLADRGRPGTLPLLLLVAGATTAAALTLDLALGSLLGGVPHGVRVLLHVPAAFLPASVAFGAIAPVPRPRTVSGRPRLGMATSLASTSRSLPLLPTSAEK